MPACERRSVLLSAASFNRGLATVVTRERSCSMAQCKLTPREFIGNVFSPQIAALSSDAAEATCQKNNLSFVQLLQPFCKVSGEGGHIKDPQGNLVAARNLRLSVQDLNAVPPEPSNARRLLNESVSSASCEHTTDIRIGTTDLTIPLSVPWFEAWRETFLSVQAPSSHEFMKHFLACMLVVSTTEDDPLERIQNMSAQLYQGTSGKSPKWFNNNALRYYVLIHDDGQDDGSKAEAIFSEMKNVYGTNNCYLLQMNSRPAGQIDENNVHLPDPWSQFLNKPSDLPGLTEQSNSPRTPADAGGLSSMPSALTTESDRFGQAAAPIIAQNCAPVSPEEAVNLPPTSCEAASTCGGQLEIGQEAIPTKMHPLSPEENERSSCWYGSTGHPSGDHQTVGGSPMNHNVWANSPNQSCIQHGARLSTQDLERLRTLITDFTLKSLLPYVEKQIALLNDVISNKKGVSRSLFSATKRWFGTNKPGAPGSTPLNTVIYSGESPELQMRRLGDLCFMFGHYSLAYQAYHSVKRDFAADQAWLYYAGALEMAALSAFMQGEMNRKTIEYMEDAILTYSNSCKLPQFATRATLLSTECLKGRGLYGEAAKQLIRMTSEDSDLRSAILLEQAAYCFIGPKMIRKYAFHAVLAGHRFSKAGQKRHSLRCYQQAYQVYVGKGWSLAEDHIHFTIGRQATSLRQTRDAVKAFEKLLSATSKQPAQQQAAFLREFLHTHNLLLVEEDSSLQRELPILPLPTVECNDIKLLFGPMQIKLDENEIPATHVSFDDTDCDDARWSKMEEILLTEVQGSTMIFKPTVALYSRASNNAAKPCAIVDEPIQISLELRNTLRIPLALRDVTVLWSFSSEEGTVGDATNIDDLENRPVDAQQADTIVLQPISKQRTLLSLIPRTVGQLKVLGLTYRLSSPCSSGADPCNAKSQFPVIAGKLLFDVRGPRLKNVKEKAGGPMYGADHRLDINVIEKAPYMQVSFGKLFSNVLCGEIQSVQVTLKNIGNAPLRNIHVICTDPKLYSIGEQQQIYRNKEATIGRTGTSLVTKISLPSPMKDVLQTGEIHKFPLWIRAPYERGAHRLDLMFYYENVEAKGMLPKYRLCRHSWHLTVSDSLHIRANVYKSAIFDDSSTTLNLVAQVTNAIPVEAIPPFTTEISLTDVSLRSDALSILASSAVSPIVTVHPRETFHFMLKLKGMVTGDNRAENETMSSDVPYADFIAKRNIPRFETRENFTDPQHQKQQEQQQQQQQQQQQLQLQSHKKSLEEFSKEKVSSSSTIFNATLILGWKANITTNGDIVVNRQASGQHYLDLNSLNRTYTHPKSEENLQAGYGEHLTIFGPERNIPSGSGATVPITQRDYTDMEFRKSLVAFTLTHDREVAHHFARNRLCIVPVLMRIQNYLGVRVDVKITTIGSSSQSHLPSMKSQVYSAQASTYFRYACHTAILRNIDPHGRHKVKLEAVLPSPGTYDLAARIQVSARVDNTAHTAGDSTEFVPQKWRMESVVCIVNNDDDDDTM